MNTMLAVFGLGGMELVLIFAVVVFLFGAKKIPGLARGFGQSIKEFKKGIREEQPVDKSKAVVEKS